MTKYSRSHVEIIDPDYYTLAKTSKMMRFPSLYITDPGQGLYDQCAEKDGSSRARWLYPCSSKSGDSSSFCPGSTSCLPVGSGSSSFRYTCTTSGVSLSEGDHAHLPISTKFMGTPSSQLRPGPSPRRKGLLPMPIFTLATTCGGATVVGGFGYRFLWCGLLWLFGPIGVGFL